MKKSIQFQKRIADLLFLVFLILAGVLVFQAQVPGQNFDDDNPYIEQPTRESYTHFRNYLTPEQDIVTIDDFDNFDIGVDFYEQYGTSNPNNPLWIFFGANANGSPQNARGTTNGGLNWYLNNPTYPAGTCCDPWAAYTGSGVLIYASGVSGQYAYRSTNNGLTWSAPVLTVSGNDRNHISAEYTGTGPYANYVYAAMTPGNFARSTDEGVTWATTFSPSNSLPGCYIAVGPNGSTNGGCVIYVTNTGSDLSRTYNFYRSTNGGANFTLASSQQFANIVGFHTGSRHTINNARTAPHPKIAMDNSNGPNRGRLYLLYASNDPPGNGNKPDIWLRYSTDQGTTWSAAIRVNDNPNPQLSDQWFPEVWCERTTGKLYIHWYDDRSNPATFQTDIYATYSTDGGLTFAANQRLNNQTFPFPNPPCSPNCYKGDYTTMTANNPKVGFSVWSDHRNATAMNMGSYFPDFAMRVAPNAFGMNGIADTQYVFVSVPAVKLYNDTALFSAAVTNPPGTGTITLALINKTTNTPQSMLTVFPDSLRMRIITAGGVPNGNYNIRVQGNGPNGTPVHERFVNINVGFVGIVSNNSGIPKEYGLSQNFPNPFNPATKISLSLPSSGNVRLIVFDMLGREVAAIINNRMNAGFYTIDWDASAYPSGVYFYKLTAGDFTETKKMILIK